MNSAVDSFITLAEIAFYGFAAVVAVMLALFIAGWGLQAAKEIRDWAARRKSEDFGRRARCRLRSRHALRR